MTDTAAAQAVKYLDETVVAAVVKGCEDAPGAEEAEAVVAAALTAEESLVRTRSLEAEQTIFY